MDTTQNVNHVFTFMKQRKDRQLKDMEQGKTKQISLNVITEM